jgi:hypothetical protein
MQPALHFSERLDRIEERLSALEQMLQTQQAQQNGLLARLEQHLIDLKIAQQHQEVNVAHVVDVLTGGQNRADWDHVQSAQLLRILSREVSDLRASLICSLISEGPISAQVLQSLLRSNSDEQLELRVAAIRRQMERERNGN